MITFREISSRSISWVHLIDGASGVGRASRSANVGAHLPVRETCRHRDDTPLEASAPCIDGMLIVIVVPMAFIHDVLDS
jgi:hypothetical protein